MDFAAGFRLHRTFLGSVLGGVFGRLPGFARLGSEEGGAELGHEAGEHVGGAGSFELGDLALVGLVEEAQNEVDWDNTGYYGRYSYQGLVSQQIFSSSVLAKVDDQGSPHHEAEEEGDAK